METSLFEVESNNPLPGLKIIKKETKEISISDYYGSSKLKEFDLKKIILERVNREDFVLN